MTAILFVLVFVILFVVALTCLIFFERGLTQLGAWLAPLVSQAASFAAANPVKTVCALLVALAGAMLMVRLVNRLRRGKPPAAAPAVDSDNTPRP